MITPERIKQLDNITLDWETKNGAKDWNGLNIDRPLNQLRLFYPPRLYDAAREMGLDPLELIEYLDRKDQEYQEEVGIEMRWIRQQLARPEQEKD